MLNSAGMDAQFERSCCAISRGILSENQILHGIAEIDVLEERKRQAEEFMAWFQPAWDALGEDEKTVLTMFYLSENGKTDAIEEISERFCVVEDEGYFTEAGLQHSCSFAPDGRPCTCSRFTGGLFRLVYC